MKWYRASEKLPEPGKKFHIKWQGFYDEHADFQDREWIEEKMRDESVEGIQWLDESESEEPSQDELWKEISDILLSGEFVMPWGELMESIKLKYTISRK